MLSSTALARQVNPISFLSARQQAEKQMNELPEIIQINKFINQLKNEDFDSFSLRGNKPPRPISDLSDELPENAYGGTVAEHKKKIDQILDSAFASFTLHVESRVANLVGKGFYTIGPCGEELLAPIGLVLRPDDPCALHYRHLAPSIARRLSINAQQSDSNNINGSQILKEILFARAKGYTVASTDPICGGHHCCLGGNEHDFLVTSTLASQSCPALGRAMGVSLSHHILSSAAVQNASHNNHFKRKQDYQRDDNSNAFGDQHFPPFPKDAVSFVTLGDGSVNNGHFLCATNLADFAINRKYRCPIVFCITDNDICISLKGNNYMQRFLDNAGRFPIFTAHGSDAVDTWIATYKAVQQARKTGRPQMLLLNDITRRFGHAATDRQSAYLTKEEILAMQNRNPLLGFCKALTMGNFYSGQELAERFESIWEDTKVAFDLADKEPKIVTRAQVTVVDSAPEIELNKKFFLKTSSTTLSNNDNNNNETMLVSETKGEQEGKSTTKKEVEAASVSAVKKENTKPNVFLGEFGVRGANAHVMRKHMNKVFDEILTEQNDVVYIGEDVEHGGYYLVTDGLKKKHQMKVQDFPPDETSLIGVGLGFSQAGLTPIVEIPYAKYLDCGFDMFTEVCIMHWLSKGKEANGLIFRLQGFGRGVFGGNYHTHNMIHIPPGLDVVCCSRGDDYSKMMRYAIQQARAGRVIMFVDATELLNLREVNLVRRENQDICWEFPYSNGDVDRDGVAKNTKKKEFYDFDDVTVYHSETADAKSRRQSQDPNERKKVKKIAVVTYGNGLVAALETDIAHNSKLLDLDVSLEVDIIDCRLLSDVPKGLKQVLMIEDNAADIYYDAILFADPCKFGQHPLSMHYQWFVNWAANGKTPGARNLPLSRMKSIGAEFTYNPLGNKLTFLNASDIEEGLIPLLRRED